MATATGRDGDGGRLCRCEEGVGRGVGKGVGKVSLGFLSAGSKFIAAYPGHVPPTPSLTPLPT